MLRRLDLALLRALRTRGHQPAVQAGVLVFTRLGEHGALWLSLSLAGAALRPARRRHFLRSFRVIFVAYLVNIALKNVFRRQRPTIAGHEALSTTVTALSYPSAHSTTAFAAAAALRGDLPAGGLYATATAMALSRPYVGVHYPSDVLAGAALGTALEALLP